MTWIPMLLADPSACLRRLVLCDLLLRAPDDHEVLELTALCREDSRVTELTQLQQPNGSWNRRSLNWLPEGNAIIATATALARMGYFGFDAKFSPVRKAAEFLFSTQNADGSWAIGAVSEKQETTEGYAMVPLQTALPLRGLAACGYATDPRCEQAYEWLLAHRLEDGAWPTGIAAGNWGRVAGYRKLPHSRWGCRSNTTGALICLAHHPKRRHSHEARRALDLLLARESRETHTLGFEVARMTGAEPVRGFFTHFARFDLALLLDLCWRIGADTTDARVASLVAFLKKLQGNFGLWEYTVRPQVSRWITFDLLRSLSRLETKTDWISLEPQTPFQTYPDQQKRF